MRRRDGIYNRKKTVGSVRLVPEEAAQSEQQAIACRSSRERRAGQAGDRVTGTGPEPVPVGTGPKKTTTVGTHHSTN